jgi:hypothetical protein
MLMGQLENLLMTGYDDTNIKVGRPSLSLSSLRGAAGLLTAVRHS